MAILPTNDLMYTTMQNTAQTGGGAPATPTRPQPTDPRVAMWQNQMRQKRMNMTGQPWGNYMSPQARIGMMGPGIASLQAGAMQGPMRQTAQPMPLPAPQGLAAPQGGINMNDMIQRRRGILPTGGGKGL